MGILDALVRRRTSLSLPFAAAVCVAATNPPAPARASDDPPPAAERAAGSPARAEVTVVATRLNQPDATSTVRVLTRAEIARLPVRTIAEALRTLPGLDVQRRGVEGIQADVSIRGADYNGTLVLVDGEPVNDAQSNHLSFDLDVPLDAVERIEVLYGSGGAVWGADALGGVVNIVTRGAALGRGRAQIEGRWFRGSTSLDGGSVRGALRLGEKLSVSLDADRREASGFRDDTEFSTKTARAAVRWDGATGHVDLSAGYDGKEYGAYGFYGTRFPDQQETTRTRTVRLAGEFTLGAWTLGPSASVRAHHDDFVLVRSNPAFYENLHDGTKTAFRLFARRPLFGGTAVLGAEAGRDAIVSTNLGSRGRDRTAAFAEWGRSFTAADPGAGSVRAGLRWDRYDGFGSRVTPHAGVSVRVAAPLTLRASIGGAFRVPTFTDLYYRDPQTRGNETLAPETATNLEAGAALSLGPVLVDAAWFHRRARNLIDYVRDAPADPFEARNVRSATFHGVEASAGLDPAVAGIAWLTRLSLSATYVFADLDALTAAAGAAEGRYVLDPLHTKWDLVAAARIPKLDVSAWTRVGYFARPSFAEGVWLWDARAGWELFEGNVVEVYVEGSNLLNRRYEERPGVPLPGRSVLAGVHVTW